MDFTLIPRVFKAITPADAAAIGDCVALKVTTAGNLTVRDYRGVATTIPMAAGELISGDFKSVDATGTTCTGIVAFCLQ